MTRSATQPSIRGGSWKSLIVFLLACYLIAALGGLATESSVGTWYQELEKPSFNPPNWLFGPVWTVLYALIAVAGWSVWRLRPSSSVAVALGLFALQLALNLAWTVVFFGLRAPGAALIGIGLLLAAVVANTVAFWRLDRSAAVLLFPYVGWVAFAALLNAAIWRLNS